ncbi:MAG TPA: NAD(P)-dependent alcohol dehydrogenase [Candidatus Acidoferrum sp.]|nr:NAD(P)-dependent alcohol dehydrogenase [Candidatus Acidoferrum sp.]
MKVVEIRDNYGVDSLRLVQRPEPAPGPGQVVLKMKAFSINYRDLLVVNGVGRWKPPLGRVPVSDGVGIVVAAGSGVTRVRIGDRVSPIFYPKWLEGRVASGKMGHALGGAVADGVFSEYTLFDECSLVHLPAHLTDEQAATLPCAGVTAWNALLSFGNGIPGDSVVVLGTGGVSIFALQFAKLRGARVIITSSSDQKLARARELGADAAINYKANPDWPNAIAALTDGAAADYVVDTVGDLKKAIAAVRLGGTVSFVGLLNGMIAEVDLVTFMGKSARVESVDVGSREMFEAMNKAIAFHAMRPVVDRVFGFSELPQALNYLNQGRHFGKVCLRI